MPSSRPAHLGRALSGRAAGCARASGHSEGLDLRARVADALALRARKGTLRALEHGPRRAANLPVMAVEWPPTGSCPVMRLVHPAMGAVISATGRGWRASARRSTRASRRVEVRRIDTSARGAGTWQCRAACPRRLRPWPLTYHLGEPGGGRAAHLPFSPAGLRCPAFRPRRARPDPNSRCGANPPCPSPSPAP